MPAMEAHQAAQQQCLGMKQEGSFHTRDVEETQPMSRVTEKRGQPPRVRIIPWTETLRSYWRRWAGIIRRG
jgi:hypothetical protein